jgi:hypothetical protein
VKVFDERDPEEPKKIISEFSVNAVELKITPLEPQDDDVVIDECELFACFHEEETTITTTPAGMTSTASTTTRFTSGGTTKVSVISPVQPPGK